MDGKVHSQPLWYLEKKVRKREEEKKKKREGGGGRGRREKQWLIVPYILKNATSIKKMLHQHVVIH